MVGRVDGTVGCMSYAIVRYAGVRVCWQVLFEFFFKGFGLFARGV